MFLQNYKLTTGSSNLNAQHKALCLRDERKICYIYQRKKQISFKVNVYSLSRCHGVVET